jgi:Tol biopolymer transport system component
VVPAKVAFHHPGFQELAGTWAPDGRHIAYPERDTLFTQDISGADRVALAIGAAIHSPAWSPDGRWIVFVEGNPDFHVRGNLGFSAIRMVPARGGVAVAITDASSLNTSPVWLPGRRGLLFVSDREGGRDIYQVALARDGSPRAAPARITTGLSPERLAISGDGRRLAWSLLTETSNIRSLDVAVTDSIPLSQTRLVTTGSQLVEAVGAVSPDGAWLYYHSNRSGMTDLWRVPLGGGDPERLTFDSAMSFAPAVSPDGREVAFHSLRMGNRDIFVMPAAGGPAIRVSNSADQEGVPAWSPDGRALIWLSGDTIRMARRNGSGSWEPFRSVLTTCGCGGWAQWSPDGRWISWPGLPGLQLFSPTTGQRRLLGGGSGTTWHVWSPDGRTVFAVNIAGTQGIRILSISTSDGRRRVLAYADNPTGQLERYGLAEHRGRLYFPLVERRSDVWVADLGGL